MGNLPLAIDRVAMKAATDVVVYAAASKLMDYQRFAFQMDAQPFDNRFTPLLVFGLPFVEFLIAAMLIFKRTMQAGLWASLILMLVFTGYIILVKARYFEKIPCSCGGVISSLSWTQHLFFNLFFVLISVVGIVLHKRRSRAAHTTTASL